MSIIRNPKDFTTLTAALRTGLTDSYELVRRMSARYVGPCADPELLSAADEVLNDPLITARVRSNLSVGLNNARDVRESKEIGDSTLSAKDRGFAVNAQRNKCNPAAADAMLELLNDASMDKDIRLKAAEALGWYVLSVKRDDIYSACKRLLEKESDPEVKDEITRTIARLKDNAYCLR
jgi:HEAT repeat protein